MKQRLNKEYTGGLRMTRKSELNAKNKTTGTGILNVPVLRYSFGGINWKLEETRKIDRKNYKDNNNV
jgi:hypothetical protein